MPVTFLGDVYTKVLSKIKAKQSNEQCPLFKELSDLNNFEKPIKKSFFREHWTLTWSKRKLFKSNLFPIKKTISQPGSHPPAFFTSKYLDLN